MENFDSDNLREISPKVPISREALAARLVEFLGDISETGLNRKALFSDILGLLNHQEIDSIASAYSHQSGVEANSDVFDAVFTDEVILKYRYCGMEARRINRGENRGLYVNKLFFYDNDGDKYHVWASIDLKYRESLSAYHKHTSLFRQEDEIAEVLTDW